MPHPAALGQSTVATKMQWGFGRTRRTAKKRRKKTAAASLAPRRRKKRASGKRAKLRKGSPEARAYMAKIRKMRKR